MSANVTSQPLANRTCGSLSGLLFCVIAIGALGCASAIPGVPFIAPSANPSEEIAHLASEVESARSDGLDYLAPTWFDRAATSLRSARAGLDGGESVKEILRRVAEGRGSLDQARTFSEVARQTLPDVIKAREDAIAAGALELGTRYEEVEEQFIELTEAIENDDLNWARRTEAAVEKRFRSVELASIKRNTASRVADLIRKARQADADRFAPDLLKDVERRYTELDQFISRNRYASEAMGERAEDVLFHANRLVHVTEEARRLARMSPPELALQNEDLLSALRQKLELPDLRNQSHASQRRQIENAIDDVLRQRHQLGRDLDELRAETASQRGRIDALRSEAEKERSRLAALERERRLNQRFVEVSQFFDPGEAEVYKKDRKLVIRVRSLQFPVGSAVVLPESYPILAKVQHAIRSFDQPRVIVEGHTDSTGSAEVNDRISQQRADAVLAYFVNNATVGAEQIQAVGKGFSEPLASDRTAGGRAQNRRIDVVIDVHTDDALAELPAVSSR